MEKRCYKESVFVPRIEQALDVKMQNFTCHVVDQPGMTKVMGRSGWSKNETRGVVGFHVNKNIYVLNSAPWTTLHELIHQAGINADRVNRFLAEGLTEVLASELKQSKDEHKATYPQERTWVKNELLPKLGMSATELGKFIIKSKEPHRDLAKLFISKGLTKKSLSTVVDSLRPQVHDKPSLNKIGSLNRMPSGSATRIPGYKKVQMAYVLAPLGAIAGVWIASKLMENPAQKLLN